MPAGMEYMDGVLEALREYLEEVNCPKKTALHLEIALEELFTNIASYAYGGEPGPVRVYCGLEGGGRELEVEDKGILILLTGRRRIYSFPWRNALWGDWESIW